MNPSRLIGCVGLALGDDPIETRISAGGDAYLWIGLALNINVTNASPEQLRRLAEVAQDLADWREAQNAAAEVANEVAAEDGVPSIGVPYQRRGEQVAA
ncbi:hypothetical protein [Streptomyces sp. NPDC057580]|uniref:hypothetical protein n=1 Tax=Streptomyces sp. NPDC057580 TaxID=3346173 RepID=UPI003677BE4D